MDKLKLNSLVYKKIFVANYPLKSNDELKMFCSKNRIYIIKLVDKIRRKVVESNLSIQYRLRDNTVKVPFKNRYIIADMSKQKKLDDLLEKNIIYLNLLENYVFELENGNSIPLDVINDFLNCDKFIWN